MKNLVNYLDDYFDENLEETLCYRKFKENKNDYRKHEMMIHEDNNKNENRKQRKNKYK